MISINKHPGHKVLELGGGNNPNPASDCNVDIRPGSKVHFTANFDEPLPIYDDEWDCVLSVFAIEHIAYPNVPQFIGEIFRILKPSGKAVVVCPNTEAQAQWIIAHSDGWDGKGFFESASCKLFGDQRHGEREGDKNHGIDSHKGYFNPAVVFELFQQAGFVNIVIQPYGERSTDMSVEAMKPLSDAEKTKQKLEGVDAEQAILQPASTVAAVPVAGLVSPNTANLTSVQRAKLFDRDYFNGGFYQPFYWDYPKHEITARHVLARKPKSVLELGCGRGYVLKRIQDAGVDVTGIDISVHCHLSRVALNIDLADCFTGSYLTLHDLCFSQAFLEYVPEEILPKVFKDMERTCQRGLHGISFAEDVQDFDKNRCTLKSRDWWIQRLPKGHEMFSVEELERGGLPEDYLKGDGKVKLNIGSYMTQFHHGWTNIDQHDLKQFAETHQYNYRQMDVRNGLPYATGSVDMIYHAHFLEHLTYKEGLSFLRECRRVLKPKGLMRNIVPDTYQLINDYRAGFLKNYNELNGGCEKSSTSAEKLWELLLSGHAAIYDSKTLLDMLFEAGFTADDRDFRSSDSSQMLKETLDVLPHISLYCDAVPAVSI